VNNKKNTTQGMVTHHELGEISHNREEEYDERRVVETPSYLVKIVRSLMA
jgi:hypothetical protein